MIILGIDPGFARLGYGVIERQGSAVRILCADTIETSSAMPHANRLKAIRTGLLNIIEHWKPSSVSVERLFLTGNQKTAIPVAEARGVVLLTAAEAGLMVYEYTPSQVKLAIAGSGTADKKAVEKMVLLTAGTPPFPIRNDDAIDALALALTAAYDRAQ